MEILGVTLTPIGIFFLIAIALIIIAFLIGFGKIKGVSFGNFKFEGNVEEQEKDYPSLRSLLYGWVTMAIRQNGFFDMSPEELEEYLKLRFWDLEGTLINNKLTIAEMEYITGELKGLFRDIQMYAADYAGKHDVTGEWEANTNLYEKMLARTNGKLTQIIDGIIELNEAKEKK